MVQKVLIGLVCLCIANVSSTGGEKTPKAAVIEKFPQDYVGKSFALPAWVSPDMVEKVNDDLYAMMFRDGTVADPNRAPLIGLSSLLVRDKLNFVLPKDRAKALVEDLPADAFTRYQIEFRIEKVKLDDTVYYLGNVTSFRRLPDKIKHAKGRP